MRDLLHRLFQILCYHLDRAEYIVFDGTKEFLILYYSKKRFIPFLGKELTEEYHEVILNQFGRFFRDDVDRLATKGIPVEKKVLTWDEFNEMVVNHPILKYDSFVIDHQIAVENGLAIR